MRPTLATAERLRDLLRARLSGRRIDRIWRPTPEMLLIDVGDGARQRLVLEVEPRHPRTLLTSRWPDTPKAPDRETLLFRNLLENSRLEDITLEDARRLVFHTRHGTRALVLQLAGRYPNLSVRDADGEILASLFADRPPADPDSPPLVAAPAFAPEGVDDDAWLKAWSDATWQDWDHRRLEAARAASMRLIRAHLGRQQRTAARLEAQLDEANEAETLQQRGELLKTVVSRLPPGAATAEVTNWYDPDGGTIVIPLDPTKTPAANLEAIFARYRKLVRTREEAEARLLDLWKLIDTLSALLAEAESAADLAALTEIEGRARRLGAKDKQRERPPPSRRDAAPRLPYRRFTAADGSEIWLGRGAADNDAMTFRHARGQDLFLHARDVPGSHVILRRRGKDSGTDPEALLDAATLAAWHSKLRHDSVVSVLFTERKHVRKGKGLAPGRVTVASPRTIEVRIEQTRIDRLYASSGEV